MPPTLAELELSMRRAPKRREVLIMLASLTEAKPLALAKACGIDARRLLQIMHGDWPQYRTELSLIPLGLAEEIRTPNGKVYRITERGRKKARQLAARSVRKAVARRAVQEHLRGQRPAGPTASASHATTSSFSWSCG